MSPGDWAATLNGLHYEAPGPWFANEKLRADAAWARCIAPHRDIQQEELTYRLSDITPGYRNVWNSVLRIAKARSPLLRDPCDALWEVMAKCSEASGGGGWWHGVLATQVPRRTVGRSFLIPVTPSGNTYKLCVFFPSQSSREKRWLWKQKISTRSLWTRGLFDREMWCRPTEVYWLRHFVGFCFTDNNPPFMPRPLRGGWESPRCVTRSPIVSENPISVLSETVKEK